MHHRKALLQHLLSTSLASPRPHSGRPGRAPVMSFSQTPGRHTRRLDDHYSPDGIRALATLQKPSHACRRSSTASSSQWRGRVPVRRSPSLSPRLTVHHPPFLHKNRAPAPLQAPPHFSLNLEDHQSSAAAALPLPNAGESEFWLASNRPCPCRAWDGSRPSPSVFSLSF
jgi:hypothetical protein